MSPFQFRLPDVGEGVAEAEIMVWHVKVGDYVAEDQSLVDVMTDKATVDMTAPVQGVITAINGEVGQMVPVGSILAEITVTGDDKGDLRDDSDINPTVVPSATKPLVETAAPQSAARAPQTETERPRISVRAPEDVPRAAPANRRRAYELGIPLQFVTGTGPGGRITTSDLDQYIANDTKRGPATLTLAPRDGATEKPIVGMRRKIAERMQEAKRRIPHINYVEECDVTELDALRADLNGRSDENRPKLTLLPFLMRAIVKAVRDFPQVNARFDDEYNVLQMSHGVHIGIATQTPAGLMVPVVRHAEARDIWDCAAEVARLSKAARSGDAKRDELSGSTITLTSLGPLGGIVTTPIINHPEVAIIAPNKIVERPSVKNGFVTVRRIMNLSSAFDHRIVDGYEAAQFIQEIKRVLEHPALIFMD